MKRLYNIKLYYRDSPTPEFLQDVEHIQTEGDLLRFIINGQSKWIPLCNVAYFLEINVKEE